MKPPAKRQKAVALSYTAELPAPLVIARGFGLRAEEIISSARQAKVPIIENSGLSEELVYLDVGSFIPESTFSVVAQLLTFVNRINSTKGWS